MITKTYRSKSDISVNVVMSSGKSLHVAFTPVTGGGSTFITSDERVQKALEGHYRYGKMFKLVSTQGVANHSNVAKAGNKVKQEIPPKVVETVQVEKTEEKERSVVEEFLNKENSISNTGAVEERNEEVMAGAEEEMIDDGEVVDDGDGIAADTVGEETGAGEQEAEINEDEVSAESDLTGKTVISVSCPDDAKEYLVEKFGISRTKLRWLKQIKEQAEANGIIFEGI